MKQADSFLVKIWGARGSYPATGSEMSEYGGNTPCVEVQAGGKTIILDSGTGIISLGKDLLRRSLEHGTPVEVILLLSHLHHDHTQGFPFFSPAFVPTSKITVYGPDFLNSSPKIALTKIMESPFFPVPITDLGSRLDFHIVHESDMILIGKGAGGIISMPSIEAAFYADPNLIRIRILRSYAHPGGVLHYRIDYQGHSLVYATDTEGYVNGDQRLIKFSRGADLLIHDAQYTDDHYIGHTPGSMVTQGFGHSTTSMACQTASAAGVKKLWLFHHAPEYNDTFMKTIGHRAKELFINSDIAREGYEVDLLTEINSHSNFEHFFAQPVRNSDISA